MVNQLILGYKMRSQSVVQQTSRGKNQQRVTLGEKCTSASPPLIAKPLSNNTDDERRKGHFYIAGEGTFLFGVDTATDNRNQKSDSLLNFI